MNILSGIAGLVFLLTTSLFGLFHHAVPPLPQVIQQIQQIASSTLPAPISSSSTSSPTPSTAVTSTLPVTGSAWQTSLPLGDYHYTTTTPKVGYIYLCHIQQGGEGAQGNPTWIHGMTWIPGNKVAVQGSVLWKNAVYSMTVEGNTRIIKSNGLPTDHSTGSFPIVASDPAYQFDHNPNSIKTQQYIFSLPVTPTPLSTPGCIYGQVGIMNDGVPLFDGFDAEYRDAVAHETQDAYEGHPDETGVYHYHGFENHYVQTPVSTVVGFAFDGFPITGAQLPNGTYLTTQDLDACHGILSPITLDGKQVTMYHYVLTQDFPYSVSCFRGKSYEPRPGAPSGQQHGNGGSSTPGANNMQGGTPPAPPQAAIDACSGKAVGDSCTVSGGPSGVCASIGGTVACKPN